MTCTRFGEKVKNNNQLVGLVVIILVFSIFLSGCIIIKPDKNKYFDAISGDYGSTQITSSLLQHNYIDINPYVTNGFIWAPFVGLWVKQKLLTPFRKVH